MAVAPGLNHRPRLLPVDGLGDEGAAVADQPRDFRDRDAAVREQRDKRVPQLPGSPLVGVDAFGTADGGAAGQIADARGISHPSASTSRSRSTGLARQKTLCIKVPAL